MKTYLIRISLLLILPLTLWSCEGEFSKYLVLENQSTRTLIIPTILDTPGSTPNDTLYLQPGATDTIQSSFDPVARVTDPTECQLVYDIDTIRATDSSKVILDLYDPANWELLDFVENDYQVCTVTITDGDLE